MEFEYLLEMYLMDSAYTPENQSLEVRIESLTQSREKLKSFLGNLTFMIATITDKDNSKKTFQLGYITGIVENILMEINTQLFNLNMEKREIVGVGVLTDFGDGSCKATL